MNSAIGFKGLRFSYDEEKTIINDFSLEVFEGDLICIKGSNGSGKSTLIKLITKLFSDYQGNISLGTRDLRELSREEILEEISVCFQDTPIYPDTIMNNVRLGLLKEEPAFLQTFIRDIEFNEQYFSNEVMGKAHNLSGGQRQKIGILRCLFSDKPIMIFDEPTSALDNKSKVALIKLFESLKGRKTILVISHDEVLLKNIPSFDIRGGNNSD